MPDCHHERGQRGRDSANDLVREVLAGGAIHQKTTFIVQQLEILESRLVGDVGHINADIVRPGIVAVVETSNAGPTRL